MIFTHGGALSNLPLFLAIDAGLMAERGIDVVAPALDGFSSTADRLRNGAAEIGTTGFTQALADADRGDPLVIVAGSGIRGMAVLGRPGSSLPTLEGAVGTFPDDPMQVLLADEVERHDRGPHLSICFMSSLAEAADRLVSGALQAITTVEPWISRLRRHGMALLSDGLDVWGGDYPDTVLVVRRSTLAQRRSEVVRVIAAMLEAERLIARDPDGALAAVAYRFPSFDLTELRAGLAGQPPRVDLRGVEQTILDRWPTVCRLNGRPATPPPPGLIDFGCLAAASETQDSSTPERIIHVH